MLAGGGISLAVGLAAALTAVIVGTLWGVIAGTAPPRVDGLMMRFVDVLYGLPYILIVVLLMVGLEGLLDRSGVMLDAAAAQWVNVLTLWLAIGAVSWLTMARVIRGQVLSLRSQSFMEAARAIGVPWWRLRSPERRKKDRARARTALELRSKLYLPRQQLSRILTRRLSRLTSRG